MKIVISEWQLCPMCIGEGVVQNVGTSSSIHRTCPVCNGNKTLIKPII
jgi:DnaJ-class molecular chaperone